MKIKPNALSQMYKWLRKSPIDDIAVNAAKSNVDDVAIGALDAIDDIPNVNYISPHNIGISDDVFADTTSFLGKHTSEPTFGTYSAAFHEISPDLNATVQTPALPLDDLVFAQDSTDPSTITVRPHNNTALMRWFQKQKLNSPDISNNITPEQFVSDYKNKRLAEISERDRLMRKWADIDDSDLPF